LLAAQVLRSPDLLWGGLVIFLLNGTGTAATVAAHRASGPVAMLAGCLAFLTGTAVTLGAILTASATAFLAGTAVAGAGFGTAMLGVFRTISTLAPPGQRADLIAAYFIASYTAFSIPVVIAGVATTHFGLHRTALVYCAVIAVLAAAAAASLIFHRRPDAAAWLDLAKKSDRVGFCATAPRGFLPGTLGTPVAGDPAAQRFRGDWAHF
jgi:MFS family permease